MATLFAPTSVEVDPFAVLVGPDEIRAFVEEFVATNPGLSVEYSETEVVANTAVHRLYLSSDPIGETGVEWIVIIHALVVDDGQIVTLTGVPDTADERTHQYQATLAGGEDATEATPAT
ncbi:MAG: nuclear transport factor 2 family protein [Chloroflexota bacterium]|nr:nuclear transport factor 2 family protein [Chloroflexota bacterium]